MHTSCLQPTYDGAMCLWQLLRSTRAHPWVRKRSRAKAESKGAHTSGFRWKKIVYNTPVTLCTSTITTAKFLAFMHPDAPSQKNSTCRHVDGLKPSKSQTYLQNFTQCRTPCSCFNIFYWLKDPSMLLQRRFGVKNATPSYSLCLCLSSRAAHLPPSSPSEQSSASTSCAYRALSLPRDPDRTLSSIKLKLYMPRVGTSSCTLLSSSSHRTYLTCSVFNQFRVL